MTIKAGLFRALCLLLMLAGCGDEPKDRLGVKEISARQVTAEGNAVIGQGGPEQARREAIDSAVSAASVRLAANNPRASLVSDVKVVDEWQEDNTYHVQILAMLSDKQQICDSPYRKKIVATAFPIMVADQLGMSESQDLLVGIPREINNQLMETGDFIGRNNTHTVLYAKPDMAPDIVPGAGYSGNSIMNIARQKDAQFVLSGVIRDFKIESGEYLRGSGVFSEIKAFVRDMVTRRSIGIDVFVHDGFTGALLFQHRYTDSILGDVSLPSGYTVGSERFNATPAGNSINRIIRQAGNDIRQMLACFPFSSRVIQVVGNHVVIAAGAQDKVKPGDHFKVYPAESNAIGSGALITDSEGVLTITDVNANSAQGLLDSEGVKSLIRPGDWVKSMASR